MGAVEVVTEEALQQAKQCTHYSKKKGLELHRCETAAEVTILVAECADVNVYNLQGLAPMHSLMRFSSNVDTSFALIDSARKHLDLNAKEVDSGKTALHLAEWGPLVTTLLNHKADPNKGDKQGNRPLHSAINFNNYFGKDVGIVQSLLSSGASISIANHAGITPIAELVLRDTSRNNSDPFNYCFPAIVTAVLATTVNVNQSSIEPIPVDASENNRFRVIHYIALNCNVITLEMALNAGEDVTNFLDANGMSVMDYAANTADAKKKMRLILDKNANVVMSEATYQKAEQYGLIPKPPTPGFEVYQSQIAPVRALQLAKCRLS